MSQLNKTLLVAKWEFMHFFKWKQEIISKLVMLGIAAVVFFWHSSQEFVATQYQVAVIAEHAPNGEIDDFVFTQSSLPKEQLLAQLKSGEIDALLIAQQTKSEVATFDLYSQGKHGWQGDLADVLERHYAAQVTKQLGLSESQLAQLQHPVFIHNQYLDSQVKTEDKASSFTAIGVLILMAIGIFVSFAQIFVSITGEKQQRVTEQLYACMDAQTWIDGKILGQMLLALKAMAGTLISMVLGFSFMQVIIRGQGLDLSFIDWPLLPWLLIFASLGLYLATAFMAAVAAAIDDPNHSGKSSFMMLPLVPMILTFIVMDSPSGWALTMLSYFPLTSFAAMPVKMALVEVSIWQPILSIVLIVLTCWYARRLAGRMFKMGMVMYGKEPSVKQMVKWALS
ncbi:ABC transporter permease [Pseudoalteromonas tunicata]|jgi:ABC-2 type transport system permease protein|uniref:ABC-type Na+ efflux pump, permease component n=1 Tax=Pseudoalteromonas tunicata D2 TaxID=87626 RepID=A4CEA2_9GAMM|nr:ABC transporter permease [Pseudoalteromonas tunicata]ATC93049.1 ABC-2 type transport system permease protein [Pseudoalteromonas tunicata]AXT32131.1 ABC transporter permease [Pseudoalteromonas tunicata]EAR26914.1 ABC-type Na+ efflux pump, permease component [Pseudoalteromonas tunicata D2]MDP5213632.1 ABC transporter permease [Pseudoalteromonas tunicata]